METRQRSVGLSIVLSIVTCGIYGIYWFICLTNDVREASKDETMPSGGLAFLLTLVTCGLYGIYWAYRMGKGIAVARKNAGMTETDNSILYLVLQIFGFGIINYALIQNELNGIESQGNKTPKASTPAETTENE